MPECPDNKITRKSINREKSAFGIHSPALANTREAKPRNAIEKPWNAIHGTKATCRAYLLAMQQNP